eukprot:GCRY01000399.1.p1 GENE.GCRY01000399.1~~GCRY01000399.1.p1  ORF type:complete len:613 (+),score=108.76 GCRY01000399.1:203-2041(+)
MKILISVVLFSLLFLASADQEFYRSLYSVSEGDSCDLQADCGRKLVCRDDVCIRCEVDDDCPSKFKCDLKEEGNECTPKGLFPMETSDIAAFIVVFFCSILTSGSGLGGGAVFVPVLVFIGGFNTMMAPALSNSAIFGSMTLAYVFNSQRRANSNGSVKGDAAQQNLPLISYDTTMMLEPLTLAGSIVGVILNQLFPTWLTVTCMALFLFTTAYRTFKKGRSAWLKENKERKMAKLKQISAVADQEMAQTASTPEEKCIAPSSNASTASTHDSPKDLNLDDKPHKDIIPLVSPEEVPSPQSNENNKSSPKDNEDSSPKGDEDSAKAAPAGPSLSDPLDSEAVSSGATLIPACSQESTSGPRSLTLHPVKPSEPSSASSLPTAAAKPPLYPMRVVSILIMTWLLFFLLLLLRGGKGASSVIGVDTCTAGYWTLVILPFPLFSAIVFVYGRRLYRRDATLTLPLKDIIIWTKRRAVMVPGVSTFAGLVAGLFGVGGGTVIGPLLLELHFPADSSAATSSFCILFSSSSIVLQFFIDGLLTWDYAVVMFCVGALGSLLGTRGLARLVKRSGRRSVIVLLISAMVSVSGVMLTINGVSKIKDSIDAGALGFNDPCE